MKIGLIDADLMDKGTRHPNLALMKIAGYHLDLGDSIELIYDDYSRIKEFEKVYISKVFNFTNIPHEEEIISLENVVYGGTGFFEDGGENLPNEIEHHKPYYDLYKEYVEEQISNGRKRGYFQDYLDYSIGFTTRGCFRKCKFCVNKKYDRAFRHSSVNEFLDDNRPYIYLWDDNILAYSNWEEVLDELEETGKPFQFRQGIDLRLMTDKKAKRFIESKYQGDFIFAFDHIEDRELITEKLQLWKRYSSKICKLYVIVAFDSQDEKDIENAFERIHILMKLGSLPYIMRYEKYKESKYKSMYIELARWCNQPSFFKKKSFREFCIANQEYKKDKSKNCSAYQAMLDFEEEHPNIAKKYFDLKFENENIYNKQYGYGRRYANKPLCKECKKNHICWDDFIENNCSNKELLQLYFSKKIDFECLRYQNAECKAKDNRELLISKFIKLLNETTEENIIEILKESIDLETSTKENIPQISTATYSYMDIPNCLDESEEQFTFEEIGYYITNNGDKKYKDNIVAQKKYGENHSKFAALLDLTTIDRGKSKCKVSLSQFGKEFVKLGDEERKELVKKLRFRIPIVQQYYIKGEKEEILDEEMDALAVTTKKRRLKNVLDVIKGNI